MAVFCFHCVLEVRVVDVFDDQLNHTFPLLAPHRDTVLVVCSPILEDLGRAKLVRVDQTMKVLSIPTANPQLVLIFSVLDDAIEAVQREYPHDTIVPLDGVTLHDCQRAKAPVGALTVNYDVDLWCAGERIRS